MATARTHGQDATEHFRVVTQELLYFNEVPLHLPLGLEVEMLLEDPRLMDQDTVLLSHDLFKSNVLEVQVFTCHVGAGKYLSPINILFSMFDVDTLAMLQVRAVLALVVVYF